jgi:hypothetical protein
VVGRIKRVVFGGSNKHSDKHITTSNINNRTFDNVNNNETTQHTQQTQQIQQNSTHSNNTNNSITNNHQKSNSNSKLHQRLDVMKRAREISMFGQLFLVYCGVFFDLY